MQQEQADLRIVADIAALNRAFLDLLLAEGAARMAPGLGLNAVLIEQLRHLTDQELEYMAGTPGLLACFAAESPRFAFKVADASRIEDQSIGAWRDLARLFVAGLLTWMDRLDERDQPYCALCSASASGAVPGPALFDLSNIGSSVDLALSRLRARFVDHPHFWLEMIRSARSSNPELRMLTHMSVIPYVLAEERSPPR